MSLVDESEGLTFNFRSLHLWQAFEGFPQNTIVTQLGIVEGNSGLGVNAFL